jgi:phage tail-like protein
MATTAAQRIDPYKNFHYRIELDGRIVAGVTRVGIPAQPMVIKHRAGGDPSTSIKTLGRTKYEAITLERGVTQDRDFSSWAASSAGSHRLREVHIVMLNEQGRPVQGWRVHRAWVSEYQAVPDLDGGANSIAIEHIKLENEGWEHDPG